MAMKLQRCGLAAPSASVRGTRTWMQLEAAGAESCDAFHKLVRGSGTERGLLFVYQSGASLANALSGLRLAGGREHLEDAGRHDEAINEQMFLAAANRFKLRRRIGGGCRLLCVGLILLAGCDGVRAQQLRPSCRPWHCLRPSQFKSPLLATAWGTGAIHEYAKEPTRFV